MKHTNLIDEILWKERGWLASKGTPEITREEFQGSDVPQKTNIGVFGSPGFLTR
jgi:hypothetical protein